MNGLVELVEEIGAAMDVANGIDTLPLGHARRRPFLPFDSWLHVGDERLPTRTMRDPGATMRQSPGRRKGGRRPREARTPAILSRGPHFTP